MGDQAGWFEDQAAHEARLAAEVDSDREWSEVEDGGVTVVAHRRRWGPDAELVALARARIALAEAEARAGIPGVPLDGWR